MKKKTPKWLISGAVTSYLNNKKRGLLWMFIFQVIIPTIIGVITTAKTISPFKPNADLWHFLGGMAIYLLSAISTMFLIQFLIKKKIGESKKWQRIYLQSKIDEHKDYSMTAGDLISQAQSSCEETIEQIRKNLADMRTKSDEAKQFLETI